MTILANPQNQCNACGSPKGLDEERAAWFLDYLRRRPGDFYLDGPTYQDMRILHGFSKADLDRSLALLRDRGLIRIAENLMVALIEESETCPAA